MRPILLTLATVAILMVFGAGPLAVADPTIIDPPKELNIDRPTRLGPPIVRTLLDFTITDVVKEFLYTSTYGTYYRYHVTVKNDGGLCTDCQVNVKAVSRYVYPNHNSITESEYDLITAPNGDQTEVVSFVVNENKLSGYQYPDFFLVTFTVDADENYFESDEDNNTWYCDDFNSPCDVCVIDDCP